MPYSFFGDPLHEQGDEVEAACIEECTNPGIKLNITHDFKDDSDTLKFLASNDINVFLYGENGEGISSVIDYALSVKRPIAISKSRMFRHIMNNAILIDNNSIEEIIERGTGPLERFYSDWSTNNFRTELDKEFV